MKLIKMKCEDVKTLAHGSFNDYKFVVISDNDGGYAYLIYNLNNEVIHKKSGFNSVNNAVKEAVKFISDGNKNETVKSL